MSSSEENCSHQYSGNNSSAYCTVVNCNPNMDTKGYAEDKLLPLPFSTKDHHKTILSYHKLKISFMCMLILNALLLVVVVICMLMIVPNISTMDDKTPPQNSDTLQDHVKCLSIKNKLNRLYRNGQMVENVKDGDKCSMEDLIDSFIQVSMSVVVNVLWKLRLLHPSKKSMEDSWTPKEVCQCCNFYEVMALLHQLVSFVSGCKCSMEDLMDSFIQHVEDVMQKNKSLDSAAFHLVTNNTYTERCQDSKTLHCLKNWKLSMNTTKISVKDEIIEVPSSGPYFLYSRVVINAKVNSHLNDMETITHSIRSSNTGHHFSDIETSMVKCGVIKNTMSHISYIEKIQYLEQGTKIKVALDFPKDIIMQPSVNSGAFGMFKL
ncbi:Hypothetical predicted protein [Mytilus galloprovincialis]|uniref:THD domain-containing protein n=1 Tax=Mytilus galloprovincialis TaxID=29158 RepID=A0A8B6E293_MYTGA|nr:Hypothetical predicted protein [Mytilus galloprovincialis]